MGFLAKKAPLTQQQVLLPSSAGLLFQEAADVEKARQWTGYALLMERAGTAASELALEVKCTGRAVHELCSPTE